MGYYRGARNSGVYAGIPGWARGRFYDGITVVGKTRIANEVKTGSQRLSRRLDRQLRKDLDAVNQGIYDKIVWTFYKPRDIDPALTARIKQYRRRSGGRITFEYVY